MLHRRYAVLTTTLLIAGCASVLGLPDEYTEQAAADAREDSGVDSAAGDETGGEDTDAGEGGAEAPGIVGLGAGLEHACAIVVRSADEREVWCWGNCGNGRIRPSCSQDPIVQTAVRVDRDQFSNPLDDVIAIASAATSTCAVQSSGNVLCWGECEYGATGNPTECPSGIRSYPTPVLLDGVELSGIRGISGYAQHYCAWNAAGAVYCWGAKGWGGDFTPTSWDDDATLVPYTFDDVRDVALGTFHACALTDTDVSCWGANFHGQLGVDGGPSPTLPTVFGVGGAATDLSGGHEHGCARLGTGRVSCWGQWEPSYTETPAAVLDGVEPLTGIAQVTSGVSFTCGLTDPGNVRCWGLNSGRWSGVVASDAGANEYLPPYTIPSSGGDALGGMKFVAAGADFACAASESEVYCWGDLSWYAGADSCATVASADCAVEARKIQGLPSL